MSLYIYCNPLVTEQSSCKNIITCFLFSIEFEVSFNMSNKFFKNCLSVCIKFTIAT